MEKDMKLMKEALEHNLFKPTKFHTYHRIQDGLKTMVPNIYVYEDFNEIIIPLNTLSIAYNYKAWYNF